MGIRIRQLYRAIQASKRSQNLGDIAILKADAFGATIDASVAVQMQPLIGYHPPIDLEKLSQLPDGTFGREYARHMQDNQLQPFNISNELEAVAQRNVFALRYAVTHDIFHILLGFDTSYAGEIGVLAFAAEQNYSPMLKFSLGLARVLYPLFAPKQRQAIANNLRQGKLLGRNAQFLLSYHFEDHWEEPINDVRTKLGLPQI